MSVRSMLAGLAATAVAASALSLVAVAPASADPASTPDANDIVGVGSDTIEDVMDILAAGANGVPGYNEGKSTANPGDRLLVSFKTVGSAQITLRQGAAAITRPVGSGAGKKLLYGATNDPNVTYARSSSAISTDEAAAGLYAYPFAVDTLKMAVSGASTNAPASLTPAQVVGIYKGEITNWSQIDASKSGVIKAYVPQAGSGTRSFFEDQLKAANGGNAVSYGPLIDTSMHENTDDVLKSDPNAIAPFSLAKQSTLYPTTVKLVGGTATWDRAVYNAVRSSSLSDTTIQGIFGVNGFICSTAARPLIEAAGFKQLATPANGGVCGSPVQTAVSNLKLNQQVATTTTLAGSSPAAKSAKLVATVTGSTAPSGSVDFFEGATKVAGSVPLVSGQATATLTNVAKGAHSYKAVFVPAAGFDASESAVVSVTVIDKAKAAIKESFPAKVKLKKAKAVVVKGAVTIKGATGKVVIKKGKKALKSASLKKGKAAFKLPKLKKGTYKLTIAYAGDATHLATTKAFTVKVVK